MFCMFATKIPASYLSSHSRGLSRASPCVHRHLGKNSETSKCHGNHGWFHQEDVDGHGEWRVNHELCKRIFNRNCATVPGKKLKKCEKWRVHDDQQLK